MKRNSILVAISHPVFISCFLLLIFILSADFPYMGYDEGLWTYIGRLWDHYNIPPYTGAVENKTPGIFVLFCIANAAGPFNILFVRLIGILATITTALVIKALAMHLFDNKTGVISMYIFGLTYCWVFLDGFAFAQTETFMLLFSTLSFYILIRNNSNRLNYLLAAGICAGMAINFKQIAITTTFALLISYIVLNYKSKIINLFKGVLTLISGTLISVILMYLIVSFYGVSLFEYIQGAWLILLESGSDVGSLDTRFSNFMNVFLSSRFVLFYPLLFVFLFRKKILHKKIFAVLVIWLVFDFIGINASGYYYGHQIKQLLPVLAIIQAIVLTHIIDNRYSQNGVTAKKTMWITVLIICFVCFPYKQIAGNIYLNLKDQDRPDRRTYNTAGTWIKENSTEEDYIYTLGADQDIVRALAVSERRSASKYFNSIFISKDIHRAEILDDLKERTPKFILKHDSFNNDLLPVYGDQITTFLNSHYSLVKRMDGIEIFKHNLF